jgi:hypothetical protein
MGQDQERKMLAVIQAQGGARFASRLANSPLYFTRNFAFVTETKPTLVNSFHQLAGRSIVPCPDAYHSSFSLR